MGWSVAADSQCGLAVVGRVWGCARSKRRIGKFDALFGAGFKHAQKKRAPCPLLLITAPLGAMSGSKCAVH